MLNWNWIEFYSKIGSWGTRTPVYKRSVVRKTQASLIRQDVDQKTSLSRRKCLFPLCHFLKDMLASKSANIWHQHHHPRIYCKCMSDKEGESKSLLGLLTPKIPLHPIEACPNCFPFWIKAFLIVFIAFASKAQRYTFLWESLLLTLCK